MYCEHIRLALEFKSPWCKLECHYSFITYVVNYTLHFPDDLVSSSFISLTEHRIKSAKYQNVICPYFAFI